VRWSSGMILKRPRLTKPEEIGDRIRELKIPGNEQGHAVRTQDPIKGAFDELEFIAITTRLRALGPERLTTMENTLAWLAVACGANPLAYALAREEDYPATPA